MGVDEPGENDRIAEVDGSSWRRSPSHGGDTAPLDPHPPAIQRRSLHRQQMPTAERDAITENGRHGTVETTGSA